MGLLNGSTFELPILMYKKSIISDCRDSFFVYGSTPNYNKIKPIYDCEIKNRFYLIKMCQAIEIDAIKYNKILNKLYCVILYLAC